MLGPRSPVVGSTHAYTMGWWGSMSGRERAARPHHRGRRWSVARDVRVAVTAAGGAAGRAQVGKDGADLVARRLQLSCRQARSGRAVRGSAGARGGPGPRAALAMRATYISAHTSTVQEESMTHTLALGEHCCTNARHTLEASRRRARGDRRAARRAPGRPAARARRAGRRACTPAPR